MNPSRLQNLWQRGSFFVSYHLGLRPRYEFGVVAIDPLILYTHYDDSLWGLLGRLQGVRLYVLVSCWWSLTVEDQREIARRLGQWMRDHPVHQILHLAPTEEEAEVLRDLGLPVVVCSQNCLVDENVFRVLPGAAKRHRAIYDARLSFFKRHELAAQVEGLALITYECRLNEDKAYNQRAKELLAGAEWLNGPFSDRRRMLSSEEIVRHLNESRVGLILSALEGANYASIQYLLCGLPVVTTRNRGGRDAFFDPDHVIWADDFPEAVARAVDDLIARKLDPLVVREAALRRVHEHRTVFMGTVERIVREAGGDIGRLPDWDGFFCNKLLARKSSLDLCRLKLRAGFARLVRQVFRWAPKRTT